MMKLNVEHLDCNCLCFDWFLDNPINNCFIDSDYVFSMAGWAFSIDRENFPNKVLIDDGFKINEYSFDVKRYDVIHAKSNDLTLNPCCGFSVNVKLTTDKYRLGFMLGRDVFWVASIKVIFDSTIRGMGDWLFLGEDTNDSVAQYIGSNRQDEIWISGWNNYFKEVDFYLSGKAKFSFVISPSKEELFSDFYPFKRYEKTHVEHLIDMHGKYIVWPKVELYNNRYLSYDIAETHWNDFGAYIAFIQYLESVDLKVDIFDDVKFTVKEVYGDLGHKVSPVVKSVRLFLDDDESGLIRTDNGVVNHGNMKTILNDNSLLASTLVIYGGSSANYFLKFASRVFRTVIFYHSTGSIDKDIFTKYNPDYVLFQSNQRFLVRPPAPFRD
ncbi:hypothetical protein MRM62_00850 [bacterium 19CA03SA04]|uniref:Uncharacterized protein n=2 Tax=Bacteria TaxID=2 RepID=A0AAU6SY22_UNCXX